MQKRLTLRLQFIIARHQLTPADLTVDALLTRAIEAEQMGAALGPDHAGYPRQQAIQRDFEEAAYCVEQLQPLAAEALDNPGMAA